MGGRFSSEAWEVYYYQLLASVFPALDRFSIAGGEGAIKKGVIRKKREPQPFSKWTSKSFEDKGTISACGFLPGCLAISTGILKMLADFIKIAPKKIIGEDPECSEIKSSVRLSYVLQRYGMDVSRNPTQCLWHSSKGGRCFSFDDVKGVWYCFHCCKSGNVFQFIMEQEGCDFGMAKRKVGGLVGLRIVKDSKLDVKIQMEYPHDCQNGALDVNLRVSFQEGDASNLVVSKMRLRFTRNLFNILAQ